MECTDMSCPGFLVSMCIAVPLGYINLEENMRFQWCVRHRPSLPVCFQVRLCLFRAACLGRSVNDDRFVIGQSNADWGPVASKASVALHCVALDTQT